jgi:hypothetical protein
MAVRRVRGEHCLMDHVTTVLAIAGNGAVQATP